MLHGLLGVAGVIGLVTLAFGPRAAMWLARALCVIPVLLVIGVLLLKWLITIDMVRL
jgi:hypothetical protein